MLIAAVAGQAGGAMPFSFLLAAVIAAFTALSYAELSSSFPLSAGEAVYVQQAFDHRLLTAIVGYAVVFVGAVSAATIARSFAGYLSVFVEIPDLAVIGTLVILLGTIAAIGIGISVWIATLVTVVSVAGLILVLVVAFDPMVVVNDPGLLAPGEYGYVGVMAGAFLAFYAFIGFEDMVNIAEEVKSPERNLPLAIVAALVISTILYMLVALAAVTSLPIDELQKSKAPLADVMSAHGIDPTLITGISLIAVVNGALVQIIMAARVLYGMSAHAGALRWLGEVAPSTRTPVHATIVVTLIVLGFAITLPLVRLAAVTSAVTLMIFALVNLALWRLKLNPDYVSAGPNYPIAVPATGLFLSLLLVVFSSRVAFE